MVQLKRNLLSMALASATMMLATAAYAQDAAQPAQDQDTEATAAQDQDTTTLDTVTVTGIRASIESAIQKKQTATSIVEAISAEDIGKLPDVSIAESLARLPGLAAQRVAGRAQVISVRGLSPDFATTTLNGRELVSTGDNRSVEFDQYPSELMSGVTIYKTPDASLVGQGLSGTIDMQTVRPLSYDERIIAGSVRAQHNSLGAAGDYSAYGNRLNLSYIDQFADRTFGISLGYSHSELPIQEQQVGLYEPWQAIGEGWRPGVPAGTFYSDGIKALRRTGDVERDAFMATLQYRPSNAWTSTLDFFHTKAEQVDTANQFEVHLGGYNGGYTPGLSLSNVVINDNGTFVGGVASGVYPLVRGMYNKREDKIDAFGWNNEFNVGVARINADISYSKAERDELNLENNTQRLPAPQLDSIALSYSGNDFPQLDPGFDYSDSRELFLANTIYGSGYGKTPRVEDELKSYRLDATFPAPEALGWLSDIEVGLNYADREKQKEQPEGNINLGPQGITAIADDLQYGLVDLNFAGVGWIPSWNVPGAVARYMTFNPNSDASYLVSKAWTVNEEITTGYVQAALDTQWGSVPVRGNIGLQVQYTDQSSSANYWDATRPAGQNVRPYENGTTYTDWLPSANLAFSFPHEQTLRVGLARQLARARVDQMRAALEFGVNAATGETGGSGGNPTLDPWEANAFDISYEKYFGSKAYVAAAYFYKDLRSYIYTQTQFDSYDWSDFIVDYVPGVGPDGQPLPDAQPIGDFTAPQNGKGGHLQGLELSASLPLDMLWAPLEGFGVQASATFNDSNIKIRDPESASSVGNGDISLPGLSDEVYNLTAYYEKKGFAARISQRKRSDFIGEIGNFAGNRTLRYVVGEDIVDAQVSYTFAEGAAFEGLTVLLQLSNLTDSAYETYAGSKDRPLETIKWGSTWLFGLNYKF